MEGDVTKECIAVDLDGTLAHYASWPDDGSIGEPIPSMVKRVLRWLDAGQHVVIFTARVNPHYFGHQRAMNQSARIANWCIKHLGRELPITYEKDHRMTHFYDDRAVRVQRNDGRILSR